MIDQNELKLLVCFDEKTGVFTWKERSRARFNSDRAHKAWNAKLSGEVAGSAAPCKKAVYWRISLNGKQYKAHRLAWLYVYGEMPKGSIDHINGIHKDNRIENLRVVTTAENNRNMPIRCDNKTGLHGVSWHKAANKWQVMAHTMNAQKYLGLFSDLFDACCARKSYELNNYYHDNHGRHLVADFKKNKA